MSCRVMSALTEFVRDVEVYSIDEAFLDLNGYEHFDLKDYGEQIVKKISKIVPVSLGIAPTRTLAKVANKYAKKYKGYRGCCLIDTEDKRLKALEHFDVGDVWGVGRQYVKKLEQYGIRTALELANSSRSWVRKLMTVQGEKIWCELNGEIAVDIDDLDVPKRSICTSRSFGETTGDKEDLREAVSTFTALCAEKLRKQHSCAETLMVFIHTNFFNDNMKQYSNGRIIKLPVATNITNELVGYALQGLDSIFRPEFEYKKAGVLLYDIIPENAVLPGLFDDYKREKFEALMPVVDALNKGYKNNLLRLACQTGHERWAMKQTLKSGCFTTKVNDVIRINVEAPINSFKESKPKDR